MSIGRGNEDRVVEVRLVVTIEYSRRMAGCREYFRVTLLCW